MSYGLSHFAGSAGVHRANAASYRHLLRQGTIDLRFDIAEISPLLQCSRTGQATVWDSAGVLQDVPVDAVRLSYNPANLAEPPHWLGEEPRANSLRNPNMVGAVVGIVGQGGAFPAHWDANANGLQLEILGTPVINGITYLRVRMSGTATGTIQAIRFESSNTQIAAATAQSWTTSAFLRTPDAPALPPNSVRYSLREGASNGTFLVSPNGPSITGVTGVAQRAEWTTTTSGGTTAFVRPEIQFLTNVGRQIDATYDIGLPQCEQGGWASSPMRPAPGATGVTERGGESTVITDLSGYVQNQGTWVVDFQSVTNLQSPDRGVFSVESTFGNGHYLRIADIAVSARSRASNSSVFGTGFQVASADQRNRCALVLSNQRRALSTNGGPVSEDTQSSPVPNNTVLRLGSHVIQGALPRAANVRIWRLTYLPFNANNSQLTGLSRR